MTAFFPCRGSASSAGATISWASSFSPPTGSAAIDVQGVATFPGGTFVLASLYWQVSQARCFQQHVTWLLWRLRNVGRQTQGARPGLAVSRCLFHLLPARGACMSWMQRPASNAHATLRTLPPASSPTLGQAARRPSAFGATILQQIPGRKYSQMPSPPCACKPRPASLGLLLPAPLRHGLCGEVRDRQLSMAAQIDLEVLWAQLGPPAQAAVIQHLQLPAAGQAGQGSH